MHIVARWITRKRSRLYHKRGIDLDISQNPIRIFDIPLWFKRLLDKLSIQARFSEREVSLFFRDVADDNANREMLNINQSEFLS